jgi:hypothetical protein
MNFSARIWSLVVTASLIAATVLKAQYVIQPKPIGDVESIVYETERIFNFHVHTNGFAADYAIGTIETWYKSSYYYFGIGSLKHPKEHAQNFKLFNRGFSSQSSKSFIYGKQNRFYAIRAGIGKRKLFSEKARRKSIVVGVSYEYGPTIGILKPYYLKLKRFDDGGSEPIISAEKYSSDNADIFLDGDLIFGGAEFRHGMDELKIRPGVHGKVGVNFSWGSNDRMIKAIEAGVMADLFFTEVPIMITEQNRPYFINLYLTLQLGKRS